VKMRIKGGGKTGGTPVQLSQRHRNCLAAVIGGTASVGANLGDIVAAVGRLDPLITEREVRQILGDLQAAKLIGVSGIDATRYVATPKGIEVSENG